MAPVCQFKIFLGFPPTGFKGKVVRPEDPEYVKACQIQNSRWQRQPALIAYCLDPDDIVKAVKYCKTHNEPIAIRSGGHGIDGYAMPQDGFVIDTSLMKHIEVDSATGIITVEAGALLGEMNAATQNHGYVVPAPAGTVSTTGAAGLTLGGGLGYLTRLFGTTVDSLLSVRVVTVDGRKLTASAEENPDLLKKKFDPENWLCHNKGKHMHSFSTNE